MMHVQKIIRACLSWTTLDECDIVKRCDNRVRRAGIFTDPRSQTLTPAFWMLTNKLNVEVQLKIDFCS